MVRWKSLFWKHNYHYIASISRNQLNTDFSDFLICCFLLKVKTEHCNLQSRQWKVIKTEHFGLNVLKSSLSALPPLPLTSSLWVRRSSSSMEGSFFCLLSWSITGDSISSAESWVLNERQTDCKTRKSLFWCSDINLCVCVFTYNKKLELYNVLNGPLYRGQEHGLLTGASLRTNFPSWHRAVVLSYNNARWNLASCLL